MRTPEPIGRLDLVFTGGDIAQIAMHENRFIQMSSFGIFIRLFSAMLGCS